MSCHLSNPKKFNHELYKYIKSNQIAEAKILISKGFENNNFSLKDKRGFISLALNFYMTIKNDSDIDNLIILNKKNVMKRDLLKYCKYYYDYNFKKANDIFIYLKENYYLDNSNLDFILENKMFKFLPLLEGKYLYTKLTDNIIEDKSILKQYKFENKIKNTTLDLIKNKINFTRIENFCKNIKFENNIIIDAGNLLHCESGIITINSYNILLNAINFLKKCGLKPIIIIHNKHLKIKSRGCTKNDRIISIIKKIRDENTSFIFETPYNQNDDLYIIYLALKYQVKVLTEDNFKDHIYNFKSNKLDSEENLIENYLSDLLVKYKTDISSFEINKNDLIKATNCIQIINNVIYIPTLNNNFYKVI